MVNIALMTAIRDTTSDSIDNADAMFRLAQEKETGIRGHDTAVEVRDHFLAIHAWKLQGQLSIFFHAASLAMVFFAFSITITSKEAALLCLVNNLADFYE
jgi:hypothetical protein